jgi:hypothetical protein
MIYKPKDEDNQSPKKFITSTDDYSNGTIQKQTKEYLDFKVHVAP